MRRELKAALTLASECLRWRFGIVADANRRWPATDWVGSRCIAVDRQQFCFRIGTQGFLRDPGWNPEIERDAVAPFMRHRCVPATRARGFVKLWPGDIPVLADGQREPRIKAYEVYRDLCSHWTEWPGREPPTMLTGLDSLPNLPGYVERMMYVDLVSYLPDDILAKVDRAAMAVSLETRVPMLDHRVVEFAMSLPLAILRAEGSTKWPLRQLLYKHVPRELVERPKMGFGVPIDSWLRGALRDWAEDLLSETSLKAANFFDPRPIRAAWHEHLLGRRNHQYLLWDVLMFQAWRAAQRPTGLPWRPNPDVVHIKFD